MVTLAYLVNSRSTKPNVDIFVNVSACTLRHPPMLFDPHRTLMNLSFSHIVVESSANSIMNEGYVKNYPLNPLKYIGVLGYINSV